MRSFVLVLVVLLPACCWMCEPAPEPKVFEESYLAYRQPNRDRSYPAMNMLRQDGDHRYFEMRGINAPHGKKYEWGKRYKLQIRSQYNRVSQWTSRTVTKVLEEQEDVSGEFRLHGISAPYFGADRRSFIDEKSFECASEQLCGAIDTAIAGGEKFDLLMTFGASAADPLRAVGVESATCYTVMDCGIREECCDEGGEFGVCTTFEQCPADKRIGP